MQFISLSVVFCLCLATSTLYEANGKDVVIYRGERDRFTNVFHCNVSNAVCSDESCVDCQCMVNQTFIQTRGQYGKCVSNELVVYATSYEDSFLLQHNFRKFCLKPYNTFVLAGATCSYDNWDYRWIWTNFGQLLNWKTLECMTDGRSSNKNVVTMKKCNRNNQRQLWKCVGERIKQTWPHWLGRSMYMYYVYVYGYLYVGTTKYWRSASKWTRFGSKKNVCSQAVRSEVFADGSPLLILDMTTCEEQSECLGGKEIKLSDTKCFLLPNKTQYLHNDTWKALEIKNGSFTITVDKVSLPNPVFYLHWDLSKTPKTWGGLMVKVLFECEDSSAATIRKTEHCVVIKYTGTFKGFNYNEDRTVYTNIPPTPDGDDENGNDDGNDLNNDHESNSAAGPASKDNTKIIIINICAFVLLCIAGVIGIIVYKRRNRSERLRNTENPVTDENSSPVVEELAESANPPNNNSQPTPNQSQLYAIPKPRHEYEYVYANDRTFALQPQSPKYEIPQSPTYEYPERPQSHQYEYPSLGKPILKKTTQREADTTGIYTDTGVMGSGYSPLVRPPVNNNESDDTGYTHLNNVQRRKEKAGATERTDKPDGLLNAMDREYTPLVRPSLKNKCEDSSHQINGQKTSDEGGASGGKNEADELLYVAAMDSQYTALARPPLKNSKSEAPGYAPLITKMK